MDGNVYAVYDPGHNVDDEQEHVVEDLLSVLVDNNDDNHHGGREEVLARIGLANSGNEFVVQHMLLVARQSNWKALNDKFEHARLHSALLRFKGCYWN